MQLTSKAVQSQIPTASVARKIRVLQVITVLGTGGATKVVLDIAGHFNNHPDFELDLLTGPIPADRTDLTSLAREQDINTRTVPSLINHIDPIINAKAVVEIRRIIAQGNYDIVHTHSSVAGVVGRLAALMARTGVIIHHVHGWGIQDEMSTATRMLYLGLERLCAKFTDRLIVVAKPDITKGKNYRIAREEKFALIYNGIELEKFRQPVNEPQIRRQLGLELTSKLVGMIGRLDKQKNPLDFIQAAAEVAKHASNVQFLLIGDGPLQAECERKIHALGLVDRVFLLGFRDDVARLLSIMTLTALSSLWEGLPITFLESMSAGKPIVANNVDGACDVVIDGKTGFLVTPHRPQEMAERILFLLKNETLSMRWDTLRSSIPTSFQDKEWLGRSSLYTMNYISTPEDRSPSHIVLFHCKDSCHCTSGRKNKRSKNFMIGLKDPRQGEPYPEHSTLPESKKNRYCI